MESGKTRTISPRASLAARFGFSLFVVLVVGCSSNKKQPSMPEDMAEVTYTFAAGTKYVSGAGEGAVESVEDDGSTIVLDADSVLGSSIAAGDVMVFGITPQTPNGLLRKVTGKSAPPEGVVLETVAATLPEAFEQLNLKVVHNLQYEEMQSYETALNGLEIRRFALSFEGSAENEYELNFDGTVLYDDDGNKNTTHDQLVADGSIKFALALALEVETEWTTLKRVKVGATVIEDADLTISTSLPALTFDEEVVVADVFFAAFAVGPVVITPNLELVLGANGELQAQLSTSASESAYVSMGAVYEDESWTPYSDFSADWDFQPPSLSASARLKAYVGPRLNLLLYGAAGPYAQVNGYLELEADIEKTPWWELYVGMEAFVGVKGELLGYELVNFQSEELLGYRKLLAKADTKSSCVQDCTGMECGVDPVCSEICGMCSDGQTCSAGKCVAKGTSKPPPPGEFISTFSFYMESGFKDSALALCHPNFQERYWNLIEVLPQDIVSLLAKAFANGKVVEVNDRFAVIEITLSLPDGTVSEDKAVLVAVGSEWKLLSW